MLIDNGADINAPGREFGNAFQVASYDGNEVIVRISLIMEQASMHRRESLGLLHRQFHIRAMRGL
jgi:hypothetical protein